MSLRSTDRTRHLYWPDLDVAVSHSIEHLERYPLKAKLWPGAPADEIVRAISQSALLRPPERCDLLLLLLGQLAGDVAPLQLLVLDEWRM